MTTRRSLIAAAGGAGAVLLGSGLAGCSSQRPTTVYTGDTRTIALAAAIENQLTDVYDTMLATLRSRSAGAGSVAAFTRFLSTARTHHTEHAKAWNALLRAAHKPEITSVPLTSHPAAANEAAAANTITALAALATRLENRAARTHLAALGTLSAAPAICTAAAIAPIEAMHAAVVDCITGGRPAPDDFLTVDGAAPVSDLLV